MFRRCLLLHLIILHMVILVLSPHVEAQNVTGYDTMPEPSLFLLREPAVWDDLALTESQISQLVELNESLDALMLGSRANKSQDEADEMTRKVMETTRAAIAKQFTKDQQMRLQQIKFRLKGISFVLLPDVAKELGLSEEQLESIHSTTTAADERVKKVFSNEFQGPEKQAESQRVMIAARKEEQAAIFEVLEDEQKRKLSMLVGEPFDSASLGAVAFKAPQLIDSGEWINTDGLELSDLRGKVVALHFFAYG